MQIADGVSAEYSKRGNEEIYILKRKAKDRDAWKMIVTCALDTNNEPMERWMGLKKYKSENLYPDKSENSIRLMPKPAFSLFAL